ncbi:MAG TPA: GH3 auxin-responsive promoter family protein [Spirochaetia bacterium]|nr:GH3 auxin-responsive promoter family protein [Spirochaetia bacterium]
METAFEILNQSTQTPRTAGSTVTATELLRQGKKKEIWEQYCGFLDLTTHGFMDLQRRLLAEQLPVLSASRLGAKLLRGETPKSIDEFRRTVPFTTYKDYASHLLVKDESVLPEKPYAWVHTSGRSGEYDYKWVPYTRRMYELGGDAGLACLLLSAAKARGEVALREGMTFPYLIAPPPYVSGIFTQRVLELFAFNTLPPLDKALTMDFQERTQEALAGALSEGLDFFFGVTSILIRISEQFSRLGGGGGGAALKMLLKPKALLRIARAFLKSRLMGRPLLPKDIWKVQGAMCGGMDTSIFKDKVVESWGLVPLEAYASTEFGVMATQTWSRNGLTFFPQCNLWEFILESDYRQLLEDPTFIPESHLMDEVKPNTEYVLAGTNLHGGALVRYIGGDFVKITTLEDTEAGVRLPQMVFVSRIDDVIDVGSFTRLTEKTLWQAIENSGIPYEDWSVRKEYHGEQPVLHAYIELKEQSLEAEVVSERIRESLKKLDAPYRDLEELTGLKPFSVTLLSKGTYRRYFEERQAAGADLAHLKPPHVNASDKMVENLMRMSSWKI